MHQIVSTIIKQLASRMPNKCNNVSLHYHVFRAQFHLVLIYDTMTLQCTES